MKEKELKSIQKIIEKHELHRDIDVLEAIERLEQYAPLDSMVEDIKFDILERQSKGVRNDSEIESGYKKIKLGAHLLQGVIVAQVLFIIIGLTDLHIFPNIESGIRIMILVIGYLIFKAILINKLKSGKNWARVSYTILFSVFYGAVVILTFPHFIEVLMEFHWFYSFYIGIIFFVQMIAIILIHTREVNHWFKLKHRL